MNRNPVVRIPPLTTPFDSGIIENEFAEELPLTDEQIIAVEDLIFGIELGPHPASNLSLGGFTFDSTLIVNTRVITVKALWEAGLLVPRIEVATQGSGLSATTVNDYFADFTDRNRTLAITPETYRVMMENLQVPHNETPTDDGVERIQTSMEPISSDRQSSQEQAVDGHGRTKPYRDDTRFPARTPDADV